jgi:hypothetical protein
MLDAVRAVLDRGTLYGSAARHPDSRALAGRGVAYAVPFPNGEYVVVRHNRHGGLLASITGDRFLAPTRAPLELAVSLRLASASIPTPAILAYAIYPAGPFLRRSDVVTRHIPESCDLAAVLTSGAESDRRLALEAAARLIGALSGIGARHHDLNLKNILVARRGSEAPRAFVLDVDRVEFGFAGERAITERNLERFMRSARKWRELYGARIDEAELEAVAASVRTVAASPPASGRPLSTRS